MMNQPHENSEELNHDKCENEKLDSNEITSKSSLKSESEHLDEDEVIDSSVVANVVDPSASYPGLNVHKLKGDIPDPVFLDEPTYFICPNCNFEGSTKMQRARGGLFTCCFYFPLCWLTECCYDYEHICPQCRVGLGSYNNF